MFFTYIKKFIDLITAVNKTLNLVLIIAVASIIIMKSWLQQIPELVPWGSEFGDVYYSICLSVVSSYIFYFIVVHIKSIKDKERISPYLAEQVNEIIGDYKFQIRWIRKVAGNKTSDEYFSDEDDLISMLSKMHPNGKSPLSNVTWFQFFYYFKDRTKVHASNIFSRMPYLDSELVRLISRIDNCEYFKILELLNTITVRNNDLSILGKLFCPYGMYCKQLEGYAVKHYKKYGGWSRYGGIKTDVFPEDYGRTEIEP